MPSTAGNFGLRCQDSADYFATNAGAFPIAFACSLILSRKDGMLQANPSSEIRARMSDVAALAGVSLKSVSRVVNGESHVSEKLRARVEQAIGMLGYVPDNAARSLAGGRNFTLGFLFDNPSPSYTMKVQQGAYAACRAAGYHLRIDNLDSTLDDAALEQQLADPSAQPHRWFRADPAADRRSPRAGIS